MAGRASKFSDKLAALPPMRDIGREQERVPDPRRAKLDELRGQIATILGSAPSAVGAGDGVSGSDDPAWHEPSDVLFEFSQREIITADDVESYFVRAKVMNAGHRVGHAPLWAACSPDPAVLALLALDPALANVDFSRALYLDTETTGLMGGTGTVPFLLGLGFFDGDNFVVEQVLLRTFAEEHGMLRHLEQRLENASAIVTYNGKTFDMPLLRSRAVMQRVPKLTDKPHLDLLHVARRLHRHRLLSCSLKSVEANVLGRERVGDVDGAEIGAMYWHFVRTGDAEVLRGVLEHNLLDVVSMISLVGLYGESLEADVPSADLAMAARTAHRALKRKSLRAGFLDALPDASRALTRADVWSNIALERGRSDVELSAFAEVTHASGDKAQAIVHYEEALTVLATDELSSGDSIDRADTIRHALVKLYEHTAKDFERALLTLRDGTGESPERTEKRRARLAGKLVSKREATRAPSTVRARARKSAS